MTATTIPLPERPAGVMFHHFHGEGYPVSQGSISAEELDRLISCIGRDRILPALDWQDRAAAGRLRPGDLCLSFDDNLLCQYRVAVPVLRHWGLTAFFFVYTSVNLGMPERLEIYRHFRTVAFPEMDDYYAAFFAFLKERPEGKQVAEALRDFRPDAYLPDYVYLSPSDKTFRFVRDRVLGRELYEQTMDAMLEAHHFDVRALLDMLWMNDEMLRELDGEGHVIGLHSHTHPTLIEALPVAEQRHEFIQNSAHLEKVIGRKPQAMSHPNNSYSVDTLGILADMGVTVGFRANMSSASEAALELPRHNHALIHRAILETLR